MLSEITLSPLSKRLGVTLLEASPTRVVGTMPVDGNRQPFGVLHGGASAFLAEDLASIAGYLHAQPDGIAVGVDLNATHHRAATSGLVTGVAEAIHLGRSTAAYEIQITDESGQRICTARLTCFIRPNPAE